MITSILTDAYREWLRRKRSFQNLLFLILVALVLWSGFAYPFGNFEWSLFPWNRAWFMFSRDDGKMYKMVATGRLENGEEIVLDLSRWFSYPVGFETARYNEIPRSEEALGRLGNYLCECYNVEAASGERLAAIRFTDYSWERPKGYRLPLSEVPPEKVTKWDPIPPVLCMDKNDSP